MNRILVPLLVAGSIFICGVTRSNVINSNEKCWYNEDDHHFVNCKDVSIKSTIMNYPPEVLQLTIYSSPQTELKLTIVNYLPALKRLELIEGKLQIVRPGCFSGLNNLQIISLTRNELFYFDENVFGGVPNLERLVLPGNRFSSLSDVLPSLKGLNLTLLDISKNNITRITSKDSEYLKDVQIEMFDLTDCKLKEVDQNALATVNGIMTLRLSENPLDYYGMYNVSSGLVNSSVRQLIANRLLPVTFSIASDIFDPLTTGSLETLDISDNIVKIVPNFNSIVSLKQLKISNGSLSELRDDQFFNIPSLEILYLDNNIIDAIILNNMQISSNLKELHLKNERGKRRNIELKLPKGLFKILHKIEKLDLSGTQFSDVIERDVFVLQDLWRLRLMYCFIEDVDDYAFESLSSLNILILANNDLKMLRAKMFYGLSNVTELDISSNNIHFVNNSSPFTYLTNLEVLRLSNNKIIHLEPSYFSHFTKLDVLHLNHNRIQPWYTSILPPNRTVQYILLHSNNITRVTEAMLNDFLSAHVIGLSNNSFNCSYCTLHEFRQLFVKSNVVFEYLEHYPEWYTCASPRFLKGQPLFTVNLFQDDCFSEVESHISLIVTIVSSLLPIIVVAVSAFLFRWHLRYWWFLLKSRVKRYQRSEEIASYQYDAFVSYDLEDSNWIVQYLLPILESGESAIKFCLHDRDCSAGDDITEEVFEIVKKCRKILLLLSESYVKNQWCMFELQMAEHSLFEEKRDSLILVQLKAVGENLLSKNLKYLITTRTYIVWTEHPTGQKLFWERLRRALAKPDTLKMSWVI